jgi:hypothetical protein
MMIVKEILKLLLELKEGSKLQIKWALEFFLSLGNKRAKVKSIKFLLD